MTHNNQNNIIQVHILVSGRVQGVGYRFWTCKQAERLGISGWVKNLDDGRVEAVFCGEQTNVDQMIKLCYSGPSAAQVIDIISTGETPQNFRSFEIQY
jgi:acylphosphatase